MLIGGSDKIAVGEFHDTRDIGKPEYVVQILSLDSNFCFHKTWFKETQKSLAYGRN